MGYHLRDSALLTKLKEVETGEDDGVDGLAPIPMQSQLLYSCEQPTSFSALALSLQREPYTSPSLVETVNTN